MSEGYWQQMVRTRISRRRTLTAGGSAGLGLAALSLIGCGGGSEEGTPGAKGLISTRTDTTKQAVQGGVLQGVLASQLSSLDSLRAPQAGPTGVSAGYIYGRLLKFKPGVIELPAGEIEGDLAESFELAPDKLQLTFKLRPGVKLDSRPPTSGREVDSQDVLFSAKKLKDIGDYRTDLYHDLNDLSPVDRFEAPDRRTVQVKLHSPDSLILSLMATGRILVIQPAEAESKFDPRVEARGWGPWRVKELRSSQKVEYEKNPDYYVKGRPFLDGISYPFVSEYATLLAQFRAKNIWIGAALKAEDIIAAKAEFPELLLHQNEYVRSGTRGKFGIKDPNSPFKDERVRQALSMLIDRQLLIETLQDVGQLTKAGVPVETRWHTSMWCGWDGAWLNPQAKDFGPNAKYYQHDPAEAKKLMAAAGHADGISFEFHYASDSYGASYQAYATALAGELQNAGMKVDRKPAPYQTSFFPSVGKGQGQFTGFGIQAGAGQGSPQEFIRGYYHSQGAFGVDAPPFSAEPDVDKLISDMKLEFDAKKLIEMQREFQRFMAKRMRMILDPGNVPSLSLTWPWVGNAGVYRPYDSWAGQGTEHTPYLWHDASKKS